MNKDLEFINKEQKDIVLLGQISELLDWDNKVCMPKKGLDSRAEQISMINQQIHERFTSNKLFKCIKNLRNKKLNSKDKLVVEKFYKDIIRSRKLPSEFVKELSNTVTKATAVWEKAKETNDFKLFRPYLEKIVKLKRKECEYVNFPGHAYNSLLDEFEEGMTVEKLIPIFEELKKELVLLLNDIKNNPPYKVQRKKFGKFNWSVEVQEKIGRIKSRQMGMDPEESRIDVYTHPFMTSIGTEDVRITTMYNEKDPLFPFFSTMHETGHALYELGFAKNLRESILHYAPSFGMHESQSRIWEEIIGKNVASLKNSYSLFRKGFPQQMKNISFKDFYREINFVEPSLIRITADEVTYCLHIILRFELELALIEGKLKVKDLPSAWNSKMHDFFGIVPATDSLGVLQDCHWSNGSFGYFPSYAIGSMYAAQLFNQMNKGLLIEVGKGNYKPVLSWLRKNVHNYGRTLSSEEIVKKCCGRGLNCDDFISYLRNKYSKIYQI
ncbi:carboxypeptidase M32 [archaeon]|nr:carboxypeptidase M32 [archaeon]